MENWYVCPSGGKQRICTIDGYAMPLTCRGGLMYLSIIGKPTDADLERYPTVHPTGLTEFQPQRALSNLNSNG